MNFRHIAFAVLLLVAAALPARAADTAAPSLAALFERVEQAYGATAPTAIRESGRTTSFRRGEGRMTRIYRAPDRFRIDLAYAGSSESRALAGDRAWQQDRPASTALHGAILLQAARLALPWNLLAQRQLALDRGLQTAEAGQARHHVELPLQENLRLLVEIDPASGRILRSRGLQKLGAQTLEFATEYADFRQQGGRLHATTEQHYAMGQHIGHSTIDSVEWPDTLPDAAFVPADAN